MSDADDEIPNPTKSSRRSVTDDLIRVAVVGIILAILFTLSALTAALPNKNAFGETNEDKIAEVDTGDSAWVLAASAMVLIMTPGVAFFYGGMVHHKNIISTMYQSFVAMGLISVLWVIIGFSLAFGKDANGNRIIGYPSSYYMFNNVGANPEPTLAGTIPLSIFAMFQMMFAIITPTLISGSLAERVNFSGWMLFMCVWHLVVYCPLAHIVWHPEGALRNWGVIDFAGGIVVEMASGYGALAGAFFLGPRKYPTATPANIPFIMLGTALFWFGWLGFNAGSALSAGSLACQTFATTHMAAAASMTTWLLLDLVRGNPTGAVGACNGIVVGLVAITPACGYVTVGGAMCIGSISCIICYASGIAMKELSRIDDSLDVTAVHGLGGTCGIILTGVFCSKNVNPAGHDGLIYGYGETLGKHLAAVVVLIPLILISSYGCFAFANFFIPLRVSDEDEQVGLDVSMHNETMGRNNNESSHNDIIVKSAEGGGGNNGNTIALGEIYKSKVTETFTSTDNKSPPSKV